MSDLGVLFEVEEDFGKQTAIEDWIALELHLHKVNRSVWPVVGGQKDAINAKGGLLYLDRGKLVALGLASGLTNQLKEE